MPPNRYGATVPPATRPSRKVPPSLAFGTVAAGCLLLLAGCVLPISAGAGLLITYLGGLALIPLALGAAVVTAHFAVNGGDTWVAVCLAAQLAAVLVLVDAVKVLSNEYGLGDDAVPGAGLWAAGVGSLLLFAGGVLLSRARIAVVPGRRRP